MHGCESRVVGQFGILVSAADECRPEGLLSPPLAD
jgi:hypothetical protein